MKGKDKNILEELLEIEIILNLLYLKIYKFQVLFITFDWNLI